MSQDWSEHLISARKALANAEAAAALHKWDIAYDQANELQVQAEQLAWLFNQYRKTKLGSQP